VPEEHAASQLKGPYFPSASSAQHQAAVQCTKSALVLSTGNNGAFKKFGSLAAASCYWRCRLAATNNTLQSMAAQLLPVLLH
jgi:hypothetical protein